GLVDAVLGPRALRATAGRPEVRRVVREERRRVVWDAGHGQFSFAAAARRVEPACSLLQAEALHHPVERRALDAKRARRLDARAVRGLERGADARRGRAIEALLQRAL